MSRDLTRWLLITLMVLPVITACASRTQSNYHRDEIGEIMAVEDVWIISSRMVRIEGLGDKRPGWGAAVGATVAGASAYGITQADNPAGVAITIVALVGGALAGQFFDEKINSELGVEYILDKPAGNKIAIVQAVESAEEMLPARTPALLIRGKSGYYRVIPQ
jgi:outer membrane lipoprotein SlyB